MNRAELVRMVMNTTDEVSFGEAPLVDFTDKTPAELDELRAYLEPIGTAIRYLQGKILEALQPHLGERGFVRFGERTYRAAPDKTIKVRRESEAEFFELAEKAGLVRRLFNPNDARVTGLRELAEGWVDPETGELGWAPFAEHFLDVTEGAVKVLPIPRSRAPQFIANSEDGEVVKR